MSYIFHPDEWHGLEQFGSKGANLAKLRQAGFRIPDWFVISSESFYASLSDEENDAIVRASESGSPPDCEFAWQLAFSLNEDITKALRRLCPNGERVAVRGAPEVEAGLESQERALTESYYFIEPDQTARALRSVWKSAFSEQTQKLRMLAGHRAWPRAPAVIVQRMLDPDCSGTAYSADPVTGRRRVVRIQSTWGLGTALVLRLLEPDEFEVDRGGAVLTSKISEKHACHQCDHSGEHGVVQVDVPPDKVNQPSLTPRQCGEVAALARAVASFLGRPQQIEWAIVKEEIFLLDVGPVAGLDHAADPDAPVRHWSSHRIESLWGGELSPASFGMARSGFRKAASDLLIALGLQSPVQAVNLREELELLCWVHGEARFSESRLLLLASMLPAFRFSPEAVAAALSLPSGTLPAALEKYRPSWFGAWLAARRFPALAAKWKAGAARPNTLQSLRPAPGLAIGEMAPEELMEFWKESQIWIDQHASLWLPLDIYCADLFSELHKLTDEHLADEGGVLASELIAGAATPDDVLAARELAALGVEMHSDPSFSQTLQNGSLLEIEFDAVQRPEFEEKFHAILEKYPHVHPGAHQIECPSLIEAPLVAYRTVGRASFGLAFSFQADGELPAEKIARMARETVSERAGENSRTILAAVDALCNALEAREEIFRSWAIATLDARKAWLEIGREFAANNLIENREDIFLLTPGEIEAVYEAHAPHPAVGQLVESRRLRSRLDRTAMRVPSAFSTHNALDIARQVDVFPKAVAEGHGRIRGKSWCTGFMKGRAAVAHEPAKTIYRRGDILAVPRGGTGWALVIVGAAGLLTESTGPYCHMVRVAREFGLPVVSAVDGLTCWLADGDRVEVNCNLGEIQRLGNRPGR